MKHYCDEWIQKWCEDNGWTDLSIERYNQYWAFPPGAVIPEPIPNKTLRSIKAQNGWSPDERRWISFASVVTIISVLASYFFKCPMPIVFAFACDAIAVAKLEVDEI